MFQQLSQFLIQLLDFLCVYCYPSVHVNVINHDDVIVCLSISPVKLVSFNLLIPPCWNHILGLLNSESDRPAA